MKTLVAALCLLAQLALAQVEDGADELERLRRQVAEDGHRIDGLRADLDRALEEIERLRADRRPLEEEAETGRIEQAVEAYLARRDEGDDWFDESLTTLFGEDDEDGIFEFHGRLTARCAWFADDRNVDDARTGSFDQSDAALWIGVEPADWIRAVFEIEYESGGDDFEVDQARLSLDLIGREHLTVSIGKFYYPFGIERRSYSSATNKLVDRPAPFRRILPGTYSDVGILGEGVFEFDASPWRLGWELAVTNGLAGPTRDDRQNLDNNDSKQVGGRLWARHGRWFEVGSSGLWGIHDDQDELELWLVGFDVRLTYDGIKFFDDTIEEVLDLRAEVLFGRAEVAAASTLDRHGSYIQLAYRTIYEQPFLEYLEYVLRVDHLDEDDRVDDFRDAIRLAAGVGWSFHENLRLKVEFVSSLELEESVDNDGVLIELSASW